MAIGKLNKYGVPISDTVDQRQAMAQPKFTNRFRVKMRNMGQLPVDSDARNEEAENLVTGMVESFTRPTVSFTKQEITSFNARGNYASRPTFDDFTITLRDEITNNIIGRLYNQLKLQTYKYQPVDNNNGGLNKSLYLGIATKFDVFLEVMDGHTNHKPLEVWEFFGCEIVNLQNTTNSYQEDSGINIINLTCSFDYLNVYQPERKMFASDPFYEEDDGSGLTNIVGADVGGDGEGEDSEEGFFTSSVNAVTSAAGSAASTVTDTVSSAASAASDFFSGDDGDSNDNDNTA